MAGPDLNLLLTLDVLLAEGSVAAAARRLRLSPSAMSRALARLRQATGDPLLVRAGRGLVPTPRAIELRDSVGHVVADAQALLRPAARLDLAALRRIFTLRNRDGFVERFGAALVEAVAREAPGVLLRFVQKLDRDSTPLRDGSVDLETGVVAEGLSPELRAQALFADRFVGIVGRSHALATGLVTPERYAEGRHIVVSRRGLERGPVDDALAALGLKRQVAAIVGSFSEALALVRASDMVATLPERYTQSLRAGLHAFDLPVQVDPLTISLLWHPRMDADPAHRWLRERVRDVCNQPWLAATSCR